MIVVRQSPNATLSAMQRGIEARQPWLGGLTDIHTVVHTPKTSYVHHSGVVVLAHTHGGGLTLGLTPHIQAFTNHNIIPNKCKGASLRGWGVLSKDHTTCGGRRGWVAHSKFQVEVKPQTQEHLRGTGGNGT